MCPHSLFALIPERALDIPVMSFLKGKRPVIRSVSQLSELGLHIWNLGEVIYMSLFLKLFFFFGPHWDLERMVSDFSFPFM